MKLLIRAIEGKKPRLRFVERGKGSASITKEIGDRAGQDMGNMEEGSGWDWAISTLPVR
jgi:hypothetical protein